MISIEEAQGTILARIAAREPEEVPLIQALNRITARDEVAPWDLPPADYSAMDGFAFAHASAAEGRLKVTGFLPAGQVFEAPLGAGEALRIMTGAPVPPGCDTVVPIEEVTEEEGGWIRLGPIKAGTNVRRRGEDIESGKLVIPAGSLVRPQEIGILAAMGRRALQVQRRPRVAILSTGDELLEAGSAPVPGRIIDSNSYSIAAQVLDAGGEPFLLGIAPDTLEETCDRIRSGLGADFLVISGGASVGDRDFVKPAIERLGGSVTFWKVDMKPGKPLAFAELHDKPVFSLPGNPVAAMVSFELFVRPCLMKAMGHQRVLRPRVSASLLEPASNKGSRPHFVRGLVSRQDGRYCVSTTGNQSSGRLSSLVQGNGLIRLAPQASHRAGDDVEVLLLDRSFELEPFHPPQPLVDAA